MQSSVLRIGEIKPIEGADRIEVATVGNFQTVVQKGKYNVGDQVLFIQADSVLPADREWAAGYLQYAPKRVKIVKLRGVYSEGCVVPLDVALAELPKDRVEFTDLYTVEDVNWDEVMGITHYDPPMPNIQGAVGRLPYDLPKTDAERWENFFVNDHEYHTGLFTQKIDGTSMTVYFKLSEGYPRLFSRSLELYLDVENHYTRAYWMYDIGNKLAEYCDREGVSLAIRGEVYGEGIQKNKANPHSGLPLNFAMYSIYNLDTRNYMSFNVVQDMSTLLGIPCVPQLYPDEIILNTTKAKQISEYENIGEGVVFWTSFGKAIKILSKAYDGSK